MERVIRAIKLDDVILLVRQQRRVGLPGAKVGERPLPLLGPGLGGLSHGPAVLAPRRVDTAQLRLMTLQVLARLDTAHARPSV
jgi:hypothetical protein